MAEEWVEKFSEEKNRKYWKNRVTKETTWKCPFSDSNDKRKAKGRSLVENEWIEKFSSEKGRKYWKNTKTKETTWNDPTTTSSQKDSKQKPKLATESGLDEDWVEKFDKKQQRVYWKNKATGETTWRDPFKSKQTDGMGDWIEKFDKKQQRPYWKNQSTGEKTWKIPGKTIRQDSSFSNESRGDDSCEWVEKFDKTQQRPYWKNYSTGETTWYCPIGDNTVANVNDKDIEWIEKFSEKKQKHYWKNLKTGETTWKNPTAAISEKNLNGDWQECYDNEERRFYWKNTESLDIVFEDPYSDISSPGKPPSFFGEVNNGNYTDNDEEDDDFNENASIEENNDNASRPNPVDDSYSKDVQFLKMKYENLEEKYNALLADFNDLKEEVTVLKHNVDENNMRKIRSFSATSNSSQNEHPVVDNVDQLIENDCAEATNEKNRVSSLDREAEKIPRDNTELLQRGSSYKLSTKELSSLGSSTKELLQSADDDDDTIDEETSRKRQVASRLRSQSTSSARRSSSGVQFNSFSSQRRTTSNIEYVPSELTSSKMPNIIQSVYESGTGFVHPVEMISVSNDKSTEEWIKEVNGFSMEQYGNDHFDFTVKSGLFSKTSSVTFDKLLSWSNDAIKKSICKLSANDLVLDAVQLYKNLSSFMGDRSSSKPPIEHALKVLKQLIDSTSELRDEYYCQIVKQTNQNPSPVSTEKGWQMLILCLALFPPSDDLLYGLMAYCVENLKSEVTNVRKYAELFLHRACKCKMLGVRKEMPTMIEIEALKRVRCVRVRVHFCDGKYLYCLVDSWTRFIDLREITARALHLRADNELLFDIFEVDLSKNIHQVPNASDRVLDTLSRWQHSALVESGKKKGDDEVNDSFVFEFKKKTDFSYELPFDESDSALIELLYVEAVCDVVQDNAYPFCSEQDGVTLASLQLQEEFGDCPPSGQRNDLENYITNNLSSYLSSYIIEQSSSTDSDLTNFICLVYEKLSGYTQFESRMSYLQFVRSFHVEDNGDDNNSESNEVAKEDEQPRGFAMSQEIYQPLGSIDEVDSSEESSDEEDEARSSVEKHTDNVSVTSAPKPPAASNSHPNSVEQATKPPLGLNKRIGGPPPGPPPPHAKKVMDVTKGGGLGTQPKPPTPAREDPPPPSSNESIDHDQPSAQDSVRPPPPPPPPPPKPDSSQKKPPPPPPPPSASTSKPPGAPAPPFLAAINSLRIE